MTTNAPLRRPFLLWGVYLADGSGTAAAGRPQRGLPGQAAAVQPAGREDARGQCGRGSEVRTVREQEEEEQALSLHHSAPGKALQGAGLRMAG